MLFCNFLGISFHKKLLSFRFWCYYHMFACVCTQSQHLQLHDLLICVPYGLLCAMWDGSRSRGGRGEGGMVWDSRLGVIEGDSRWGCVQWALGTPRAPCPPLSHHVLLHPGSPSTTTGQLSHSRAEQRAALMYPELMFNECSVFRQVHVKSENGFIVLLLRGMCAFVCVLACTFVLCRSEYECVCVCVCQTSVYKSLRCPGQVYLLMYSCSECTSTDLQTHFVS